MLLGSFFRGFGKALTPGSRGVLSIDLRVDLPTATKQQCTRDSALTASEHLQTRMHQLSNTHCLLHYVRRHNL